jgi:hypothetical protein
MCAATALSSFLFDTTALPQCGLVEQLRTQLDEIMRAEGS